MLAKISSVDTVSAAAIKQFFDILQKINRLKKNKLKKNISISIGRFPALSVAFKSLLMGTQLHSISLYVI